MKFTSPYRTHCQPAGCGLFLAANQILQNDPEYDTETLEQDFRHYGVPSVVYATSGSEDQARWIARQVYGAARELRLPLNSAVVLVYASSVGQPLARALSEQGLPARFVKSSDFDLEDASLKVTTLHAAKGLEFPIVAIAHVEAGRLPRETAATEYKHGRKRTRTGKRVKGIGFIYGGNMQYRRLGDAGMKVSAIALGGWINFGEGKVAEDKARRIVTTAYEQGINFFDLADSYGKGGAEWQMGRFLKQFPRHTLVISTKLFWPMSEDVNDRGLSRKHIMESIDRSLQRLDTDYVDIYFCHRPDPETPILETARAMDDLIHQGKVLYWGTSEWTAEQIREAVDLCRRHGLYEPKAEQPQYSMLWRERVENELLPVTQPRGIGLVVWSPLAMGMLTGKYDEGVGDDTRFGREPWARERFLNEDNAEKVRRLKPIADELGISRAQLALAWVLRQPGVSSAITGATRPSQVEDNARAADVELSDDVVAEIEAILAQ